MNLKKITVGKIFSLLESKPWIVFIFFVILIFTLFGSLFRSYFEADEWVHFTYYLPLTGKPDGFLTALISTFVNTGFLTGEGQHINPIGTAIFFLNTKFFDLNYVPYAFISLLLHSINSFLVFLFIKISLPQKRHINRNIFALLGGIFFALPSTAIHAITGAAPFYSYNVLSLTFFLLCVISFKTAFIKRQKKLIYTSIFFLFFALLSKETTTLLFIILPFMALIEKRTFPLKFLARLYILSLIIYICLRFVLPHAYSTINNFANKWSDNYITSESQSVVDTKTIVSKDLSIHKNIYVELFFRSVTFPVKITSELYFPRQTILSFMSVITPIVYPLPTNISGSEEMIKSQNYQFFINGPGNDLIIYILSIVILVFVANRVKQFLRQKEMDDFRAIITGLAIVVFGTLPLVMIVLSFPRWGYDTYFDSRHFYLPSVGGAILFPFLLLSIGEFISKIIRNTLSLYASSFLIVAIVFIIWFMNNMNVLQTNLHLIVDQIGAPRRKIIAQMKNILPALPQKAVFYVETDGLGAYGPVLPFQTSVAQALTVVYYDKNPLPDEFFNKFIFEKTGEGYKEAKGRGFGYFTSKKALSEALLSNSFTVEDIYGFYYNSQNVKVSDIAPKVRLEMEEYLKEATGNSDWKVFRDPSINLLFLYPPQTTIEEKQSGVKSFILNNPNFQVEILIFSISPTFGVDEFGTIRSRGKLGVASSKKVSYDKFHYNDALVIIKPEATEYLIKFNDKLISLTTPNLNDPTVEKILGSVDVFK